MVEINPKRELLEALEQSGLKVISNKGKTVFIEHDYEVEVEGEKLFKLLEGGQVIAPFNEAKNLCDFIIKDIQLNEEG